jgi:hypothetical protein
VVRYNNHSYQWGKDSAKERILKDIMLTLVKAANKPNKKKAARQKKCVSEGCTNQSVSFGKCISHGAKVNKTKCKALLSSGERQKNMHRNKGYAENRLIIILTTLFKIR